MRHEAGECTSTSLSEKAAVLRAIATLGTRHANNDYDRDRYQRVLDIALEMAAWVDGRSFEELKREYLDDNWVHVSPMNGAEAAVFRGEELLLMRRTDDGLWCIPGGLVEMGETLAECAERELREETGVSAKAVKLLGVFDSRKWRTNVRTPMFHSIFLVESENPVPSVSNEASEVGFFGKDALPPLSPGHDARVPVVFELVEGKRTIPFFDEVRS